jgi:DNA helicase-2/ATP-dependent DNA helicase PcrA
VAILGIPAATAGDISDIYSYLVEPAFRRDLDLYLGVDRDLDEIDNTLIEPGIGYPWSVERLRFLTDQYRVLDPVNGLPPMTPIERRLLAAFHEEGLHPQVQYGIQRFRVDFAFPDVRLAVEADGRAFHDAERDGVRDRRLGSYGWKVIRFSGSRIYWEASAIAEEVSALVSERRRDGLVYSEVESVETRSWWKRFLDWLWRRSRRNEETDADPVDETPEVPDESGLDPEQKRAAYASDGVVQVIAPAGSGKTTTIVRRVEALVARGVPANRILTTTFNRASVEEITKRLLQRGIAGTEVRSFHSLGRHILNQEGHLRPELGPVTYGQLRRIAKQAMDSVEGGVWIDAPLASELISDYKLAKIWDPEEARRRATNEQEATAAEIYRLYEEHLADADRNDFDDLIIGAVRLVQADAALRSKWQAKWETVLVDEYQDIEPAQELLIRLVAAPQDSIFAVGDEDQCIYSWRRASVERIVLLDTVYPGLERVVLETSYRCPPIINRAATQLIAHNKRRFPKTIHPSPISDSDGEIEVLIADDATSGPAHAVKLLRDVTNPQETVVLARTSQLLRDLVLACVSEGIAVRAPASALDVSQSEQTVLAYFRLASDPRVASEDDVKQSFRVPNRYLPQGAEVSLATSLKNGRSFRESIDALPVGSGEEWRNEAIRKWAEIVERLGTLPPLKGLRYLRAGGGLDRHYSSMEQMTPHDQIEIEALDDIEQQIGGKSLPDVVALLEQRANRLHDAVSEDGIELATIHGAKGREWSNVIVYGFDAGQLPHRRTLGDATNDAEFEEALEDERRLAYVAITRAKQRLVIVVQERPSPFLSEAGIITTREALPTLESIRKEEADRLAAVEAARQPQTVGKPKTLPSTKARYPAICPACKKPIEVGSTIVKEDDRWVHQSCA